MFKYLLLLISCLVSIDSYGTTYIQLIDKLDRPNDGYCLDVVGSGQYVRFDMPLTAHNCKGPEIYDDELVTFRADGTLFFTAYQGCVTVMGNNHTALPGNALMLKRCGENSPFLNGPVFQHFLFNQHSQIQLKDSDLCIVAGERSSTTYSEEHRWRSLYMDQCSKANDGLSKWKVISPGSQHE